MQQNNIILSVEAQVAEMKHIHHFPAFGALRVFPYEQKFSAETITHAGRPFQQAPKNCKLDVWFVIFFFTKESIDSAAFLTEFIEACCTA